MLKEFKIGMMNVVKSLKGDVIVSDIYDYEYDVENQKDIKQIYPNNEDIDIYLGLSDEVEDGDIKYDDDYMFDKYIPYDRYVYKLDDTFKFDQHKHFYNFEIRDLHYLLQGVMLNYKGNEREVLNRWVRRHDAVLCKTSPTVVDECGDNLHDALLVVEHDKKYETLENIAKHCRYVTISRIAIVDTPWTQKLIKKNGKTMTKTGVDRRLHVYTIPLDVEREQERLNREFLCEIQQNVINRKLDEFLSSNVKVVKSFRGKQRCLRN